MTPTTGALFSLEPMVWLSVPLDTVKCCIGQDRLWNGNPLLPEAQLPTFPKLSDTKGQKFHPQPMEAFIASFLQLLESHYPGESP